MRSVTLSSADANAVFREVAKDGEPVLIVDDAGEPMARVLPIPKPVRSFKGRPVYRIEDMMFVEELRGSRIQSLHR